MEKKSATTKLINVNDFFIEGSQLSRIAKAILGEKPLFFISDPGLGKTFFVEKVTPVFLKEITGKNYRVHTCNLNSLRYKEEISERKTLKNNNIIIEPSPLLQDIYAANKANEPIILFFDEANRLKYEDQTLLFQLLEHKKIHLEYSGGDVPLPEGSKIILAGNTDRNKGVYGKNEALLDRVKVLAFKMPQSPLDTAKMAYTHYKQRTLNGAIKIEYKGIIINSNSITKKVVNTICRAIYKTDEGRKYPISFREVNECIDIYKFNQKTDAIDGIIELRAV